MRYLDLTMAALIGVSAITGVISWDPKAGDTTARQTRAQVQLRDGLVELLQRHGMLWFAQSPPAVVCAYFAESSNSSYGLYATLGSVSCGSPPAPGSVVTSLAVDFGSFEANISAWSLD